MAIDVKDLPPKYQAQALQKYMAQQKRRGPPPSPAAGGQPKASKYHNSPTERIRRSARAQTTWPRWSGRGKSGTCACR